MKSCVIQSTRLHCIFARSTGDYNVDDHRQIFKIIVSLDLFRDGASVLFEMQRVNFGERAGDFGSSPDDPSAPPQEDHSLQKIAQIVSSDTGAMILQEFGSHTQKPYQIKEIFRSLEDALNWLALPGLQLRVPKNIDREIDHMLGSKNGEKEEQPKVVLGKEC